MLRLVSYIDLIEEIDRARGRRRGGMFGKLKATSNARFAPWRLCQRSGRLPFNGRVPVQTASAMATIERPVSKVFADDGIGIDTPFYLIDESRLLRNLERIARVRERSGAKSVLALKCFSTWAVFDLLRRYLDGTTSSSLYEARLGSEYFGKEVHAYSVAFSDDEIDAVIPYASKIIFNSLSQLARYESRVRGRPVGLRINPGISHSAFELADPARRFTRLGATDREGIRAVADAIDGVMFHCNCENSDLAAFQAILEHISREFGDVLHKMDWVSLGGGIGFTRADYPVDGFCETLAAFAERFGVQIYLEPGDAVVSHAGQLVTRVLDIVRNEIDIAIVDAGVETHMLDLLVYQMEAKIDLPEGGRHRYMVAGRSCLAGDVFGTYAFPEPLRVGSRIAFADAAAYTLVKKNWFNGLPMPSIVVRRLDGRIDVVKTFGYEDYRNSHS
jgi:carboxynorspermidine decarboxylase